VETTTSDKRTSDCAVGAAPTAHARALRRVLYAVAGLLGVATACRANVPNEGTQPSAREPLAVTSSAVVPVACVPGFGELAERANPAVAFIETVQDAPGEEGARGLGAGFVIDPTGLLLTNYHVVRGAKAIAVTLPQVSGAAEVVGFDAATDIAVLRIRRQQLPALPLGSSAKSRVGDWVVAIGNPFGLEHTVSAGIISAKGRTRHDVDLDPAGYYDFIQTDASINPGNSGGPLLNLAGEVIGINTAVRSGANNIGFAIPIDMVRALLPALIRDGKIARSALGVVADTVARDSATVGAPSGALVRDVQPGGPADQAGLRAGDVLLELDGQVIEGKESLRWLASIAGVGKATILKLRRSNRTLEITVVLGRLPED
jgi:serine protease Do